MVTFGEFPMGFQLPGTDGVFDNLYVDEARETLTHKGQRRLRVVAPLFHNIFRYVSQYRYIIDIL